jgi:hypothetical protein
MKTAIAAFPQRPATVRVSKEKGSADSLSQRGEPMKIKKLFQVLVLGATTLGLGIAACGGSDSSGGGQQQTLPDGGHTGGGGPPGW